MARIRFPKTSAQSPFFKEIIEEGYHVFSRTNAKIQGFYPNKFPDYPGVKIQNLRPNDTITIIVFFRAGTGEDVRADCGYIDLEVESVGDDSVLAVVLTELPGRFPLETGSTFEVFDEEILYKTEETEH